MTITVLGRLGMWAALLSLVLFSTPLMAASCTPDSITLSSQAEVDSFQADHGPGCDTIASGLTVDGLSITDLTPLSGLTTGLRNSTIKIQNTSLTSLAGLSGLTSVHWIEINNNGTLTSIAALSTLTSVSGPLFIQGNVALTNVDGLGNLTSLTGGALWLQDNASLTDLSGVSGLTNIGASLVVDNNDALTDLDSLAGLTSVAGNINISDNDTLTNISGLSGLVGFTASLSIRRNSKLASIGSLPNLTDIGGLVIWDNNALTNLGGLSGLNTIGTNTSLAIMSNDSLTDIDGLAGIVSAGFDVKVTDNFALGNCSSLKTLLDQVDDALPGPGPGGAGIPDVGGDVTISGNLDGCNSIDDIVGPVAPPFEISVPFNRRVIIDGKIDSGEWRYATHWDLGNGFIKFNHDNERLYVLIDVLTDNGDDPFSSGGGDQFWLYFDLDEDGAVTWDVDFRYRLESGTGNLRKQTFCESCTFGFNPLEPQTLSSRGEGFGCFVEDNTFDLLPLRCDTHRVWELAIDLDEIGMRADGTARFGYLISSGSPSLSESKPADLNDAASYGLLTLQAAPRQLSISGPGAISPEFEVTQAIQTPQNDLDLVAGKSAAVRIWADSNESTVKNFIFGTKNGVDLPGSPMLDVGILFDWTPINIRDSIVWNSFTSLPASWSEGGTVDFNILVRGLDNSTAAVLNASILFAPTERPVYWTVPVRNNTSNVSNGPPAGSFITNSEQALQNMVPIEEVQYARRPVFDVQSISSSEGLKEELRTYDQQMLLSWTLGLLFTGQSPFDIPEQITGFFSTSLGTAGGSSDPTWFNSGNGRITWISPNNVGGNYGYAHEINHNIDKDPTGSWGLHSRGCGATGQDTTWPYGTDFNVQETGVNWGGTQFQSVFDGTPDVMSYCASTSPTQWISPYRWNAWLDLYRTDVAATASVLSSYPVGADSQFAPAAELTPEDSFYLLGRLYPDGSGSLGQVLRQPGLPDPVTMTSAYTVRVLDCSTATLAENNFDASFVDVEGVAVEFTSFSFILPASAEACSIELTFNDVVLDTRTISANAPVVTLISPNGGEVWSGKETIQWTASDTDGDPLLFTLLYSPDGGLTWHSIATKIDANQYEVDSLSLPGSDNARIRVLVSDGANTTHDDSDGAFTVLFKPPAAEILFPADGGVFTSTHAIRLSGLGRDTFGHHLATDRLTWEVDSKFVGDGLELDIYLEEGSHQVTLTVQGADEKVTIRTVAITVSNAPGTIAIAPDLYSVNEDDGSVSVSVVRTGGAAGNASVVYWTMDNEAISGGDAGLGEDDFNAVLEAEGNTLEWPDGDATERTLNFTINPDEVQEGDETFKVFIKAVNGEVLGTSIATVTIHQVGDEIFADGFE